METSRSRAVNKSEKHELELGHRKRKGMTGHAFKALFKKQRKVNTPADEGMERPKRLPDVGSKRNGVSGTNKVEDVRSSKDCVAVEETFVDSRRMVDCSMPELRTREVWTSQLGSLNLAGPVSIGKSVEGDTDPSTHDKALISERKKDKKDSDTDLSAMGKTNSICAPEGLSSPAYERERRDSEEICVPFSKRVREDRDSVKEDHCSSDGADTRGLHNTLVPNSWNGPSLMEDRVGSKASEKRHLNSSLEDEANLIDSVLDQLKAHPLISGIAEKKAASLKKLQKCCENRMSRIVEDQRKEIQEFHRSWEQKRVALAKKHKVDSARICSERRHPESTNMLEILDKEFAKKMERYKQQKEMSLKELKEKQLASRNDESQKAAHWLTLAKSSANGENVHIELPLHGSENGNQVGYSGVSENEPPAPPEKVVPEVRVITEEPSMDEVPSTNETTPNGISSNVVSEHISEIEGKTMTMEQLTKIDDPIDLEEHTACIGAGSIPCGVAMDIDTGELGTPVLEFDCRKTDRVYRIDSNAPNAVKKPNDQANNFISCNLSTIGEKASPLNENERNKHLNCGQERDSSSILSEKKLLKEPQNTKKVAKSSANGESVHVKLPLHGSQNGNQVGYSGVTENEPPARPENVVPEVRVVMEEPNMEEVPSINENSLNGKFSNVVSVRNSDNEGKTMTMERALENRIEQLSKLDDPIDTSDSIVSSVPRDLENHSACTGAGFIPCGVGMDIETTELGTPPVLEFDNRKTDGGDQIESNAPNNQANSFISAVPHDLEEHTACIGAGSIPCGVGMDTEELGTPVLEFNNRKTDRGDQIDSFAPNNQTNTFICSNLSTIGEKCLVEASSLKQNDTKNHLKCGQERDSSSILSEKKLLKEPENTRAMGKISKLIKKVQKKCDKRKRRLVQKHEEEIQEFNQLWEQKRVILEKNHELDLAINISMQRYSGRIEELDALNSEFAKKIEEYKHQKELFLKDLEQKQLAERNEECRKAADWLTKAKSVASDERGDGEPSCVGNSETSEHGTQNGSENIASLARDLVEEQTPDKFQDVIGTIASQSTSLAINTETVVANTTSENDVVMVSSEEAPVNRVELPNSSSGTDLFSVSANLVSGRPRDPEKKASDDVTLSRAEAIAHDTLSDFDALAVIGIENSDKENNGGSLICSNGGSLICSNVFDVQDDSINPEKVPPSESSDIAQLEHANHEAPLVELPKEPQPELSMNLHATPMNFPPACELVHAPEATLQTGVINKMSPPDGLAKPIQHNMDNMEEGLKETVVSCSFTTEAEIIFPGTPRSPNEEVEEISLNILATRIEGANNDGSGDRDETLASTSPHACLKKLNSDGKRSIELGEGVVTKQRETAPTGEVGLESIEREIADKESSQKILIGCSNVSLKETVVSCSFNTEGVTIFPWSARPPNEEDDTLATRIEGANSVGSSDRDETIALTSPHACSKKLNPEGKRSIEQAEGVVTKQRKTASTEEVGFESIEGGIAGMESSNEKILIGCSNVVGKESDGANSIIPGNSPSRGQSLEICSPHHPVVSAICDLPLPPNPETRNKVSQCIVSRDENGQASQILSQQVEVLSPEVQSTVPPVVENQIHVAEDRSDLPDHIAKQIGGDLERDHPVLFSESPLGPNPDNSSSQDTLVLPQVVELNADSLIHSNLQSEPNLSGQGSNNDDQVTSWMSALTLLTTNLQNELERISYEKEQVTKRREALNLRLEYECAKEKEERIAQIKSKYESNIKAAETDFLLKRKEIETMQNKLLVNEKLSETFRSIHLNPSFLPTISMQQVVNSSFTQLLHQLPPLQLVPRPSLMTGSPSAGLRSPSQHVSVTPPPFQVVHQSGGLFYSIPTRPLTITSITPVTGNTGTRNDIRTPAPHLRPFRPSASSSPPLMTPSQHPQTTLPVTPNSLHRASPPRPPPPSPSLWSQHSQSIYPRASPPVPPHSSWPAQSAPRLSQPIPPLQTHYVGHQSQHAGGNMAGMSRSPPLGSSWPPAPSPHPLPQFSTNFSGFQSPHYSSLPSYTNQSSLHHRQQPETAGASTSTPGFTDL